MAAAVVYAKKLQAKRLARILSFENRQIDKCVAGRAILCDKAITLRSDDADSLARQFAVQLRDHCRRIRRKSSYDFKPTHRISFTADRLTWEFRFRFDQSPPMRFIECRTPPLNGTIILDQETGAQFEAFIKSLMKEETSAPSQEQKPEA
jgi:hypothetical protein